jgi:hypothetical protein
MLPPLTRVEPAGPPENRQIDEDGEECLLEPPDDVFRVLDMYRLPRHTRVFVGGGVRR